MLSLQKILTRADVSTLEGLIGKSAVGLLGLIDEGLVRGESLRAILSELRSEAYILSNRNSWQAIVELLNEEEVCDLLEGCRVIATPNPWNNLKKINISRNKKHADFVYSYFMVTPPVEEKKEIPLSVKEVAPSYGMFEHQRVAAQKITEKLYKRECRVVLHMPTGSGKTRTAMHIICNHLRAHSSAVVIWLAYSEELCQQAAEEFECAWASLGDRPIEVVRFWGKYDCDLSKIEDGFIVAGLAKTYSRIIADLKFGAKLGQATSLIVIDEAHQAVAETYSLLLDCLQAAGNKSSLLGLTATPGRSWDDFDEDRKLTRFFDNQKVSLSIPGYSSPLDYLVDKGYLARPEFRNLNFQSGLSLTEADLDQIMESLDIPQKILESIGENEQRNLRIVCEVESLAKKHKRILVFASSVENSHLLATALEAHGSVSARSVDGNTPIYDRQRFINWFKADHGEPRVLCNFGVLTTGFDAPKTSAVVIARPTKSLVLYSQMVGRAIRGVKARGNETAEIVTVVDTDLPGFRSLAESFSNWEDTGWDSK